MDPLYVITTDDHINLRSIRKGFVITTLPKNTILRVLTDKDIAIDRLNKAKLVKDQDIWLEVRTPSGYEGICSSYWLTEYKGEIVKAEKHGLVGLHGPSDPEDWAWDEEAFRLLSTARIQQVKLLCPNHSSKVAKRLQQNGIDVFARIFIKFDKPKTVIDSYNEVINSVKDLYNIGITNFEIFNEPNLHSSFSPEGLGVVWKNGMDFSDYFISFCEKLKNTFKDIKCGFPGLSPGSGGHLGMYYQYDSNLFAEEAHEAIEYSDFICFHTYWGYTTTWLDSFKEIQMFAFKYPNKIIDVSEFSNSNPKISPVIKGNEYKNLFNKAKELPLNVRSLNCYTLSASVDHRKESWKGTEIPLIVGSR